MGGAAPPDVPGHADLVEIGRGGFATVYRARRVAFDQDVAIKVLGAAVADEATAMRFDRERRALGALAQHPFIVTVYDGGTTPAGQPYLVMEYLPHGSLAGRLARAGPLPVPEALAVGVKLAGALETAHRAGILHRDLKPANVLVSRYGDPLLADFGIARVSGAAATASGVVTASIAHAPPEVLDGGPPTAAADVYSLASTLFCLVAGASPVARAGDDSVPAMLARVFREPVPDLRQRGVPPALCLVLERALAKEPSARPPSALALGEQLRGVQAQLGLPPTPLTVSGLPASSPAEPPTVALRTLPVAVGRPVPPLGAPASPPPRRGRLALVLGGAVLLVAAVAAALVVGRDAVPVEASAGPPSPVVEDLDALLLQYTDFSPGGSQLDSAQAGDVAMVLFCPTPVVDAGRLDDARRRLASGDTRYFVNTYIARFAAGRAKDFLANVRSTAADCARNFGTDPPRDIPTPTGGDEAVRVTAQRNDMIWVRRGDYVVAVEVAFASGPDTDTTTASDLAARATGKLVRGLS